MPWLMALRVVSLPAATSRMKNEPNSCSLRRWPSTSACMSVEVMSSRGPREPLAAEVLGVLEELHAGGHELLDRGGVLRIADAEDGVGELEDAPVVARRDAHHLADDLERQRRGDLADEVALAARRDGVDDAARARSRTISSTRATVRGVKPLFTSRRSLVWRGASMLIIEPKNSSSSIGRSPMLEPWPGDEQVGRAADRPDVLPARHRPEPRPLRQARVLELLVPGHRPLAAQQGEGALAVGFRKRPERNVTQANIVDGELTARRGNHAHVIGSAAAHRQARSISSGRQQSSRTRRGPHGAPPRRATRRRAA